MPVSVHEPNRHVQVVRLSVVTVPCILSVHFSSDHRIAVLVNEFHDEAISALVCVNDFVRWPKLVDDLKLGVWHSRKQRRINSDVEYRLRSEIADVNLKPGSTR
jgi:hypothetical protein